MTSLIIRTAVATALGTAGMLAHAATVNFSQWAYGDSWGNVVNVGSPDHIGAAGAFKGAVAFTGTEQGFSGTINNFISYCVEIDESFYLPSGNMTGYNVVAGASYTKWNNPNATGKVAGDTAIRLGQLLSYVGANSTLVDTAAESTSLQLAIWNIIYDTDNSVTSGVFSEKTVNGAYDAYANTLLNTSRSWTHSLDVFVLQRSGSQDFVLTRDTGGLVPQNFVFNDVPEPASLALASLALGAAGLAGRRRRAVAA